MNKDGILRFKPEWKRTLYKAEIDVVGNHLSGIIFIKKMEDSTTRIVFTNQAGLSFFDFEFDKNSKFKVYSIIDKMNKKAVIKTLEKDFSLILFNQMEQPLKTFEKNNELFYSFENNKDRYYYIVDKTCMQLVRMERGSKTKKIVVAYFESSNTINKIPEKIIIKHTNFNFTILLTQIADHVDE